MSILPRMPHFPWWTTAVVVRELYEGPYRNLEAEWLLRKATALGEEEQGDVSHRRRVKEGREQVVDIKDDVERKEHHHLSA